MKTLKWTRVEEGFEKDKQSIIYDLIVDNNIQITIFLDECREKSTEVLFFLWLNAGNDILLKKKLIRKSLVATDMINWKPEALNLAVKFLEKKISKIKSLI